MKMLKTLGVALFWLSLLFVLVISFAKLITLCSTQK